MISTAVIGIGSILIYLAPFGSQFRDAPSWMRSAMFLAGVVGLIRAALGLYLESLYSVDPSSSQYWTLSSFRPLVSGIAVGILTTLMLSEDFRRRGARFTARKV